MLSRSADNLYWMSRYIERAENIARMLETSSQFLLDLGKSSRLMDNSGWRPILEVLCVDEDYERLWEVPLLMVGWSVDRFQSLFYFVSQEKNSRAKLPRLLDRQMRFECHVR